MKTIGTHPINAPKDSKGFNYDEVDFRTQNLLHGLTKKEHFMLELTKAYISAGSTGMPQPEELVKLAAITYEALIAELNK